MYEYRHVVLPQDIAKRLPKDKLLSEPEWRALGVQQSRGWGQLLGWGRGWRMGGSGGGGVGGGWWVQRRWGGRRASVLTGVLNGASAPPPFPP